MRLFTLLLFVLVGCGLSSCISPKKAAERYQPRIDSLAVVTRVQADTIQHLTLALERSRGGNDMLLETQNRLQDRLGVQDDRIEELESNLSSTSDQMSQRVTDLRAALVANDRLVNSLLRVQSAAINAFSADIRRAANLLSDSLETKLAPDTYEIAELPGELVLSVQEMVLFRPRSVGYLARGNEAVLKVVTQILQQNPLLKLRIVGHTDNQPNTLKGTDNWKYAALRASTLAKELAETYYVSPNRLLAASQGEYGPTRSNASPEGRSRNRRVDFVFTNNVGNLVRQLERLAATGE
ncbi:OmpA/MotB family protein [Neolewinella sp.]|uniref:OmpA/MotB family protein n=1 Tax=Neolewinella sp. TaxID=2993543 RepID=UPI003B52A826